MIEYFSRYFAQLDNGLEIDGLPVTNPEDSIGTAFDITILTLAAIAVLIIVLAGFKYVTSAGDPQAVAGARKAIVYSVVGLVVAGAAWSIVTFVVRGI
jgi:hypothetical protein